MRVFTVYLLSWEAVGGFVFDLHFCGPGACREAWHKAFKAKAYDTYRIAARDPEDVYYKLNCVHPADYKYRSLSVGDIVVGPDGVVHMCRPHGWEIVKMNLPEVPNAPDAA